MVTAKIFQNGRSQAVRLPKEFRFSTDEVFIKSVDGIVMLLPKEHAWESLGKSLDRFTADFMEERVDEPPQNRDLF